MKEFGRDVINIFRDIFSFDKVRLKKQIPNLLTMTRIVLLPFVIAFFLNKKYLLAVIFLFISAVSDFFDGRYARRKHMASSFGALLDAICDKIFVFGVLIALLVKKTGTFSPLSVILFLEIVIMLINGYYKSRGVSVSSTIYGKIKTNSLYATLIIYFVSNFMNISHVVLLFFVILTIICQIMAINSYFYKYFCRGKKNEFAR